MPVNKDGYGFVTVGCRWTRKADGGWRKNFIYRAVKLRGKPEKRTSHE